MFNVVAQTWSDDPVAPGGTPAVRCCSANSLFLDRRRLSEKVSIGVLPWQYLPECGRLLL